MKAILFDFDGVLVDTERKKFLALQKILSKHNIHISEDLFPKFIGKKTRLILEENTSLSHEEQTEIIQQRQELINAEFFPGVVEKIRELHCTLGIVTGSQRALVEKTLRENNVSELFSVIISGEDVATSKPNPECYLLAIKKLGLSAKEVIVVEDSPAGVAAARAAGCIVYGLLTSIASLDADKVFSTHEELFTALNASTK